MSFETVAKKDFQDASRSYLLWGMAGVFTLVLLVVGGAAAALFGSGENPTETTRILGIIHIAFQYVVPLIAIVTSYGAIVNERESGSLKILLSLPHSREDVVVGKVLGRASAFAVPFLATMAILGVALALISALSTPENFLPYLTFAGWDYLGYTLLTVVFGLTYVSLATGVSATFESRFWVLAVLVAFYFLFNILWFLIRVVLSTLLRLTLQSYWPQWMPLSLDEATQIFKLLSPAGDISVLKRALFNDALLTDVQGLPSTEMQLAAIAMLAAWILLPVGIGLYRFTEADL